MRKRLAKINLKLQLGVVVVGLAVFAFVGHMFVVAPKTAQITSLQHRTDHQTTLIFQRQAALRKGSQTPTIQVADLFKLTRAMPDRLDMPGIILTLSEVARASGIRFDLIEPVAANGAIVSGAYQTQRIHLQFNGDFYALSDFLFRLRSLVAVHDGTLRADGRLFNVDTVSFHVGDAFPQIAADLYVNAYQYGSVSAPAAPAAPSTDSSTTTTSTDSTTAAGANP